MSEGLVQQRKERVRWLKPAQFGGRLNGLESLRRKCSCPRDFQHQVIQVFRTTLSLEWWRHLEKFPQSRAHPAAEELDQVQGEAQAGKQEVLG